jgi:hypothetical protein
MADTVRCDQDFIRREQQVGSLGYADRGTYRRYVRQEWKVATGKLVTCASHALTKFLAPTKS